VKRKPTEAQYRVFMWIQTYIGANGYPPTRKEIATGMGCSSGNAAEQHLRALQKKGWVVLKPGIARGIQIIESQTPEPDSET